MTRKLNKKSIDRLHKLADIIISWSTAQNKANIIPRYLVSADLKRQRCCCWCGCCCCQLLLLLSSLWQMIKLHHRHGRCFSPLKSMQLLQAAVPANTHTYTHRTHKHKNRRTALRAPSWHVVFRARQQATATTISLSWVLQARWFQMEIITVRMRHGQKRQLQLKPQGQFDMLLLPRPQLQPLSPLPPCPPSKMTSKTHASLDSL